MEQAPLFAGLPERPSLKRAHGRPLGSKNKRTEQERLEVQGLAQQIVEDLEYRKNLLLRARRGQLHGSVETMLWHYAYGKPAETVNIYGELSVVLEKLKHLGTMSDEELAQFLEEVEGFANSQR